LAIVIGGSSRPIVWRTPMASIRMSAAQARTVRLYLIRADYSIENGAANELGASAA
jgi:hypothetical protein